MSIKLSTKLSFSYIEQRRPPIKCFGCVSISLWERQSEENILSKMPFLLCKSFHNNFHIFDNSEIFLRDGPKYVPLAETAVLKEKGWTVLAVLFERKRADYARFNYFCKIFWENNLSMAQSIHSLHQKFSISLNVSPKCPKYARGFQIICNTFLR